MAKSSLSKMLSAPDKEMSKTSGENGILARFLRQILYDNNINEFRFNIHMLHFLNDPKNGYPNDRRIQTSAAGNLVKEFVRPQMTWKVFCKALRFLGYTSIELTIIGKRLGRETVHSTTVNFANYVEDPFDEKEQKHHAPSISPPVAKTIIAEPNTSDTLGSNKDYKNLLPKNVQSEQPVCALLRPNQTTGNSND